MHLKTSMTLSCDELSSAAIVIIGFNFENDDESLYLLKYILTLQDHLYLF